MSQKNDVKIYPPCPIYTRTTHSCVRMSAVTVTLRTFQQLHYIYAHGSTTKHTHTYMHTQIYTLIQVMLSKVNYKHTFIVLLRPLYIAQKYVNLIHFFTSENTAS